MINISDLHAIMPSSNIERLKLFVGPLNDAMSKFQINTRLRIAAFIAQTAHESGGFHYLEEIASGKAYEGRKDLGNVNPGDGVKYKGRGGIGITGRANYLKCGIALGVDLINNPTLLSGIELACASAAWFWQTHGLNEHADKEEFLLITKIINGGTNGLADREDFYKRALKQLK